MDIAKAFVLIVIGTYVYAYVFSFHWVHVLRKRFPRKAEAA